MKIAIMQPYFFPYIGYFQLINAVDKFVFLDDVHFINRGWINRNRILVNGKANMFTVPLQAASQNKLISEINIVAENWQEKILKTIELAYKKAPQFAAVNSLIQEVFLSPVADIATLAKKSIMAVCSFLGIPTVFIESASVFNNQHLKASDRIIDISRQLDGASYYNLMGGEGLYDRKIFSDNGIQLHFVKTGTMMYSQYGRDFVPALSIIDVLMFNSKNQIQEMLLQYELV
jgi:hypothetical protein